MSGKSNMSCEIEDAEKIYGLLSDYLPIGTMYQLLILFLKHAKPIIYRKIQNIL